MIGQRNRGWKYPFALQLAIILVLPSALAQSVNSQEIARIESARENPLDGLQFSAAITSDGDEEAQNRPLEDELAFNDGQFSSLVCARYNFAAAPYWIRRDGERIHFLAEMSSPTDGTMVWKGTIRNGKLEGTMRWIKKRWYWTIDAKHTVRGELSDPVTPVTSRAN